MLLVYGVFTTIRGIINIRDPLICYLYMEYLYHKGYN